MQILVIGGTGFIGAPAAARLRELGHEVATFHRAEPATIRGDCRNLSSFRDAFARLAPALVVDTIAYSEGDGAALAATFRGLAERLLVLSSQDVYAAYGRLLRLEDGRPDSTPASEDATLRSSRYPYRASAKPGEMAYDYEKILVERAVSCNFDLPATILRLPCVYGPGDRHGRVGQYLRRMDHRAPAIELDEAKARWRWTRGYVENVADAIALAATDPRAQGRTYNLGEEEALTEADWARGIACAAGWSGEVRRVPRERLPAELSEPYDFRHDLVADTRRIRDELGYRERIPREEALRRTIDWERSQP